MEVSHTEWILNNWKPDTTFQALAFAKNSKCEDWSSCLRVLEGALINIGSLNLKHNTKREVILWARKHQKKPRELLDTTLCINNTREGIDDFEEDKIEPANDTVDEHNIPFEDMFKKLNQNNKWYLSTGKCVDDELFMFSLQCESDHPSRSLIIDLYDKNYTSYNVFTEEELQEIINYKKKSFPKPPDSLKKILNQYKQDSTAKLRTALGNNHTFHSAYNKEESADKDWITLVIFSLVREYENGNMNRPHNERWYQTHIWSMIESCFDKLEDIEAIGGEQYNKQHTAPLKFGASEAKSKIEDKSGTNFMNEGFYKLPRTLKDMLDSLLKEINFDHRSEAIRTVGFIHSGLSSTLIELDRPTKYISRVSRCKALVISNSVDQFGPTVLPVILSTWVCSEIVKEAFEIISSKNKSNENGIAWFDNCLERRPLPNMPTTSSSSETAQKKLKSYH
ncbi:hypothetical protein G6F29_011371 [Rhizopus arrhizus]|nr:hypothetical protein G6F29_011371 [Rhizopus arrhizus]KAG1032500.1 hypothetical protein G6F25_011242 [Rhizopus arrhizus]